MQAEAVHFLRTRLQIPSSGFIQQPSYNILTQFWLSLRNMQQPDDVPGNNPNEPLMLSMTGKRTAPGSAGGEAVHVSPMSNSTLLISSKDIKNTSTFIHNNSQYLYPLFV